MSDENDAAYSQCAKPRGEEGRELLLDMNRHHAPVYEWCLEHMPKAADGSVLDIGCGGGEFIARMAERYPFAMFFGADISPDSLAVTREVNSELIAGGGLELRECSVERMPFVDGAFDIVTSVENFFFWPDLRENLKEVARVVSAGGILVIGSEMRLDGRPEGYDTEILEKCGAKLVRDEVVADCMDKAGFDVSVHPKDGGDIVAYVGVKRI